MVHLDDLYDRNQNITEQFWTLPYLPGKKKAGKTVFVLTSSRTFSAGEMFSYDLKSLKRATLIGETTGGGAHTVAPHRIDDHFFIRVPFGQFVNRSPRRTGRAPESSPTSRCRPQMLLMKR